MIEIEKTSKFIQLVYSYGDSNFSPDDWVINELKKSDEVRIAHRIFTLKTNHVVKKTRLEINPEKFTIDVPDIVFNIAELTKVSNGNIEDEYYKIYLDVLVKDKKIFLHKDIEPSINYFIAETNISIFKQISELVQGDIIIGSKIPDSIPLEEFYGLINTFPTTYEKKLYA